MSLVVALCCLLSFAPPQSVRLNPELKPDRDVSSYRTSPDGRWATYLADLTIDGVPELVSVDVRGDKRVRSLAQSPGQYEISGDSRRIVFSISSGIYSMDIAGRTPPVFLMPSEPGKFWIVPDDSQVVVLKSAGLFRVPIDGHAAPELVHANTIHPIHPASVAFSPDGRYVSYVTEGSIVGQAGSGHVYSRLLDGSAPEQRLNDASSRASIESFLPTPDSRRLLFRRGGLLERGTALLSVPFDGSSPPRALTPPLPGGADLHSFFSESWTPKFAAAGTRVVYSVDAPIDDHYELFSAPIDGSEQAVQISSPAFHGHTGYPLAFFVTHDGQQVYYVASEDLEHNSAIYRVPVAGGEFERRLTPPLPPGGSIRTLALSPDDRWFAYSADLETPGLAELYIEPFDGSAPARKLSQPGQSTVIRAQFLPDSSGLVYATSEVVRSRNQFELFGVSLLDARPPTRLDGPMVAGGSVTDELFALVLDGARLLYRADQAVDGRFELYSVAIGARPLRRR